MLPTKKFLETYLKGIPGRCQICNGRGGAGMDSVVTLNTLRGFSESDNLEPNDRAFAKMAGYVCFVCSLGLKYAHPLVKELIGNALEELS